MKRKMNASMNLRTAAWVALMAGAALVALPARAQNALGDGRNLQRQTGNAPLPPVKNRNESFRDQMRLNDAIATGNATGGRAFRGNTGYRAVDDFRGRLGSDDLFFAQREMAPAASWADVGSSSLRYQLDRTMSLKRMGSNIDGILGRGIPNEAFNGRARPLADADERISLGLGAGSLRSTSAYQIGRALTPATVGRVESDGFVRSTEASGLRGLTVRQELSSRERAERDLERPNRIDTLVKTRTSYMELQERLNTFEQNNRIDQQPKPEDKDKTPDLRTKLEDNTKKPERKVPDLGTELPTQTNDRDKAKPADGKDQNDPNKIGTVLPGDENRDPVTGLPRATAGSEAWRQRMAEIRKALDEEDKARTTTKQRKPSSKSTSKSSGKKGDDKSQTDKNDQKNAQNQNDDDQAARTSRLNRDTIRAIRESGGTVDKFVSNLSPGGEDRDIYAELMVQGQKSLASGRYFDAEEQFSRAATLRKGDATALVGRLHAQLGAGMVLSASSNLRSLVREHPELVGVRYAPSLLPSQERLKHLNGDLDLTIHPMLEERLDLRARREAALLKAYVAFQIQDRPTIANSLRMMEDTAQQMGEDESVLAELLRGVWLGEDAGK